MFTGLRAVTVAASAAVSVIVARLLGPSGAGEFALVSSLLLAMMTVSTLGIETGVSWMVSGKRWDPAGALRTTRAAGVLLGLSAAGLGALLYVATSGSAFSGVDLEAVLPALLAVPFALIWIYTSNVALALDRYEAAVVIPALQAGGYVAGVLVLGLSFGLAGATAGLLVGHVVACGAALVWSRRERVGGGAIDRGRLRRAMAFGVKTYLPSVLTIVSYRFDLFLLSAYGRAAEVGYYSVAVAITTSLWMVPSAISAVTFPRVAALSAGSESEHLERERTEAATLRHTSLVLVVGVAILVVVLVGLLDPIWGESFSNAREPGLILLPGAAGIAYAVVVFSILAGRGRPDCALRAALISTPVAVVLYFALIPAYGANGAALGSTISYCLGTAIGLRYLRGITGRSLVAMLLPGRQELADWSQAARRVRHWLRGS